MMLSYGRPLTKLRISLLDTCNYSCVYCMPDKVSFCAKEDYLSVQEIETMVGSLVRHGVEEVRLTGGEPTLRHDLCQIIERLNTLNLKKISLTTNASRLKDKLKKLKELNIGCINISLDSLQKDNFEKITGNNGLANVLDCIQLSKELGIKLKINMVVMKNINHYEISDFVRFGMNENLEVRFLEVMNIGVVRPHFEKWFYPGVKILGDLKGEFALTPVPVPFDSTAKIYETQSGSRIGLIASESMPFCGGCSRLRLTSKGVLRACLMKEDGISLRGVGPAAYEDILKKVAALKPLERIRDHAGPMYKIGG